MDCFRKFRLSFRKSLSWLNGPGAVVQRSLLIHDNGCRPLTVRCFTLPRYVITNPLRSKEAEEVVKWVILNVILIYSMPKTVMPDYFAVPWAFQLVHGLQFCSTICKTRPADLILPIFPDLLLTADFEEHIKNMTTAISRGSTRLLRSLPQ